MGCQERCRLGGSSCADQPVLGVCPRAAGGLPQRPRGPRPPSGDEWQETLVVWQGRPACALAVSVDHAGWGGWGGGSTTGDGGADLLPGRGTVRRQWAAGRASGAAGPRWPRAGRASPCSRVTKQQALGAGLADGVARESVQARRRGFGRAARCPSGSHTRDSPGSTLAGRDRPGEAGGNRFPREGETMSALAARGIRKSFGRRQVLAGVDLQVGAGQLVAVVGEDGTGKTTLLRILAGDLRPDAGSVAIDGRPGYCPQISTRSASFHNASVCGCCVTGHRFSGLAHWPGRRKIRWPVGRG